MCFPFFCSKSFRALDRTRKGSLSEKDFRRAFEVSGVHAPDWVLDRAVSLARSSQEEASCDYNQFIAALGFEVPNDHAYFQSGLDSLSRSVHGFVCLFVFVCGERSILLSLFFLCFCRPCFFDVGTDYVLLLFSCNFSPFLFFSCIFIACQKVVL